MANVIVENLSDEDYELLNQLGFPGDPENNIIEVTPNRPDMLSKVGIKRTLDLYRQKIKPNYSSKPISIEIIKELVTIRPYIELAIAKLSSKLDIEDLIQFQEKIHETYGRKRKRVAIGIHDYSKITPPIIYKAVHNEKFIPLNSTEAMDIPSILEKLEKGREYKDLVKAPYPMLYDKNGVISFPPIINSDRTKLEQNTSEVFIDVTGTNEYYVKETMKLILCYMIDIGAQVESTVSLEYKEIPAPQEKIAKLLGFKADYKALLNRSGIFYDGSIAKVPPYRIDFMDWTDVAEEIAINYGYNNIARKTPQIYQDIEIKSNILREIMDRLGFSEVYTSFLVNYEEAKAFMKVEKLLNSVSEDYNSIRSSLEYSLLKVAYKNKTAPLPYKIYEIGRVYYDQKEHEEMGFLIMDDNIKIEDYLSVILAIADELKLQANLKHRAESDIFESSTYIYGNIGKIKFYAGAVKYKILKELKLDKPVVLAIFKNIAN